MSDLVGRQLGNYRLINLLGEGGFAAIYRGKHIFLNWIAAIKVLTTRLTDDEIKHFLEEARILARLKHPNIVQILEFGVEVDAPYLVMSYAPNRTLLDRFPEGTRLPLAQIVPIVKQVASALEYVHSQELMHLDIKPANLLLGFDDEVWLSDFGIARAIQSAEPEEARRLIGTVAYMAPEQLQQNPCRASDQYTLAVVVYEWLSGSCPFTGTDKQIWDQHLNSPPPSLSERFPDISSVVEEVVFKALAKDPDDRYPGIEDFANALEEAYQKVYQPGKTIIVPRPGASRPIVSFPPSTTLGMGTPPPTPSKQPDVKTSPPPAQPATKATLPIKEIVQATLLYTYKGHTAEVRGIAWSPDGTRIASASEDRTVQVWDATTGSNVFTYRGHSRQVWSVVWSPDGKRIGSAGFEQIAQVWQVGAGEDVAPGEKLLTYRGHTSGSIPFGFTFAMAWSPDGQHIASGSDDQTVQVWHAVTGENLLTYRGHDHWVEAVAWSPDGQYVVSGSSDKTVQLWDAITGDTRLTYRRHVKQVRAVAWAPDGKHIASGSSDGLVHVWEAASGNCVLIYRDHARRVCSVAWSPDSMLIASASDDRTVHLWNAITGNHLFTCRGHSAVVNAVAWSPDGQYIASASNDGTVRVWGIE